MVISPYFSFICAEVMPAFPCPAPGLAPRPPAAPRPALALVLKMYRIGYEQEAMRASLSFSDHFAGCKAVVSSCAPRFRLAAVRPAPAVLKNWRRSTVVLFLSLMVLVLLSVTTGSPGGCPTGGRILHGFCLHVKDLVRDLEDPILRQGTDNVASRAGGAGRSGL